MKKLIGPIVFGFGMLAAYEIATAEDVSDAMTISLENLASITYQSNLRVAASRYNLVAAEIDFEPFEKNLAQITHVILKGELGLSDEDSLKGG